MKQENVYLYGAGIYGQKALNIIENSYPKLRIKAVIDKEKTGSIRGKNICSIDQVDNNSYIIIAIYSFEVAVSIFHMLLGRGFSHIYWFFKEHSVLGDSFLEEQCISCDDWIEGGALGHVEMHIMDACNLNCRGCTHFSPIFEKEVPDFHSRIKDVEVLAGKISYIHEFFILGGEPFLNPDLENYVKDIRRILPRTNLYIVTNGLLIPSINDYVFQIIKENNVTISITEYPPVHRMMQRIENKLEKNNVVFEKRSMPEEAEFNLPLSTSCATKHVKMCISHMCVNICNGNISCCPTLMFIDKFNEVFEKKLPNEGIIKLKEAPVKWELVKLLEERVPLCDFCIKNTIKWRICNVPPILDDFAVCD